MAAENKARRERRKATRLAKAEFASALTGVPVEVLMRTELGPMVPTESEKALLSMLPTGDRK